MTNFSIKTYHSERLYYAMMTEGDGDLMLDLDSDPELMRYITRGKTTTADDMSNIYIPRMKSYTEPARGWGLWKAFRREDDQFIGWFLLRPLKGDPEAVEIGWRFKRKFWGKGYGTEGAVVFRDHAFEQPGTLKLIAIAMPDNEGSRKIMEKIGMTYIKTYLHEDLLFKTKAVLYEMNSPKAGQSQKA